MKPLSSFFFGLVLSLFTLATAAQGAVEPLNILLVNGGCCHDYEVQGPVIKSAIESNLNAEVTIAQLPNRKSDSKFEIYESDDWFEGYDLVIHNECTAKISDKDYVDRILDAHRQGVPALNLHCAMHSFRWGNFREPVEPGADNAAWFEMIGLQSSGHGPKTPIEVVYAEVNHPVINGLEDWTTPKGELYNNIQIFDGADVLASGSQIAKGKPQEAAILWTNNYGPEDAKILSLSIGHSSEEMMDENFEDLLVRGVLWTTGNINPDGSAKNGLAK